jgi:cbb3-type cytochrome oxidase maturation protein
MDGMIFLIPITLAMGIGSLVVFLWSLKTHQYDDPKGAAHRILVDDEDAPLP